MRMNDVMLNEMIIVVKIRVCGSGLINDLVCLFKIGVVFFFNFFIVKSIK